MVSVFNEEDIIEEMINHHISQGVELVVLDTGSTDATYEICKKLANNNQIKLFQNKVTQWDLAGNLRMTYDLALKESPDWIIHMDADEFFESGKNGINLEKAIMKVDSKGYNLIQFDRFEFFITDNDEETETSIVKKLNYYSHETDFIYRAWKFFPGIENSYTGGHYPIFPKGYTYKIYPEKFVCRHYMFRSKNQASKKLNQRLGRLENMPDLKMGWNTHYQRTIEENKQIVADHKLLTKYNEDNNWNYEEKLSYYTGKNPKRNDIFSEKGILKMEHLSYNQLKLRIKNQRGKIQKLKDQIKN